MRRKLWLLLILFLFLVGRESCCASSAQTQSQGKKLSIGEQLAYIGSGTLVNSLRYWIFDLHQKKKGWYTCKFYHAAGYRTKLFYNRLYLDFYYSLPILLLACLLPVKVFILLFLVIMNINVRIYRDFYIVISIPL